MKQFVIFAAILLFGSASFALPEKCVEKAAELKKDKAGKEIKEGKEHKSPRGETHDCFGYRTNW